MGAFENREIAFVRMPTAREVMERLCKEEACHASPLSAECALERDLMIKYLVKEKYTPCDAANIEVCRHCASFKDKLQEMMCAWEDWLLGRQEVFS